MIEYLGRGTVCDPSRIMRNADPRLELGDVVHVTLVAGEHRAPGAIYDFEIERQA